MAHPTGLERLTRLVAGPVLLVAAVAALSGYAPLAAGPLNVVGGVSVLTFGAVLLVTALDTDDELDPALLVPGRPPAG